MPTLTYVDSGVLIAAARGTDMMSEAALRILGDPDRVFASSIFVKLEVLPKPTYFRRDAEREFYEAFFDDVRYWARPVDALADQALEEACQCGLAAVDALHVASAASVGAAELVTTEKPGSSLHKARTLPIVCIRPAG